MRERGSERVWRRSSIAPTTRFRSKECRVGGITEAKEDVISPLGSEGML